ncbi:MAG TPA: ZIP family metal transporter [Cytophagales bacterium]|jgi:zinc transporter ZupT|nr:ZIP family metal transporter [Cytophagales bacterium]
MEFLLPFIGVIAGAGIALLINDHRSSGIKLLLAFSGAFLMALSLFDLLPEVYEHLSPKRTGLLIMLGILLQIILEFFSKGAEHGHVHMKSSNKRLPVLLFASLALHSFLEGFPLQAHQTLIFGVLIHKIPIALLLTSYLLQSGYTRPYITGFILLFAIMTPLGTWVSILLPMSENLVYSINALIVGIFLHISSTIIFESGEGHKFNLTKLVAIVSGVAVAFLL